MLFTEALKDLQDGKYVTRNGWNDGSYLALLPAMQFVWKVTTIPNPAAGNWLPTISDLNADDWKALDKCAPHAIPDLNSEAA